MMRIPFFQRLLIPVTSHRDIFAERMPNPIFRQHYPGQIRMIAETNPEKIEHLALIPVGGPIYRASRFDLGIFAGHAALQSQPFLPGNRLQVVNDLESRLGRIPIDARYRTQAFRTSKIVVWMRRSASISFARLNLNRQLVELEFSGGGNITQRQPARDYRADLRESSRVSTPPCPIWTGLE